MDAFFGVDLVNCFTILCPKELPVLTALEIISNVNILLDLPFKIKAATLDWHDANHCSFIEQGGPYPSHGVKKTFGSEFIKDLNTDKFHIIFRKGFESNLEALSLIEQFPWIPQMLLAAGIKRVFLAGLATNICVMKFGLGLVQSLEVYIVEDAAAGTDIPSIGISQKEDKIAGQKAGIKYISTEQAIAMVKNG